MTTAWDDGRAKWEMRCRFGSGSKAERWTSGEEALSNDKDEMGGRVGRLLRSLVAEATPGGSVAPIRILSDGFKLSFAPSGSAVSPDLELELEFDC
jgi:hypothetical protein